MSAILCRLGISRSFKTRSGNRPVAKSVAMFRPAFANLCYHQRTVSELLIGFSLQHTIQGSDLGNDHHLGP